mmetsp:Transcript_38034/g.122103  ORF Transcript_38034/g.122103 Transcript_38034/m.122103 type:complete len:328 (-) Transcript_38034:113-1096(-)
MPRVAVAGSVLRVVGDRAPHDLPRAHDAPPSPRPEAGRHDEEDARLPPGRRRLAALKDPGRRRPGRLPDGPGEGRRRRRRLRPPEADGHADLAPTRDPLLRGPRHDGLHVLLRGLPPGEATRPPRGPPPRTLRRRRRQRGGKKLRLSDVPPEARLPGNATALSDDSRRHPRRRQGRRPPALRRKRHPQPRGRRREEQRKNKGNPPGPPRHEGHGPLLPPEPPARRLGEGRRRLQPRPLDRNQRTDPLRGPHAPQARLPPLRLRRTDLHRLQPLPRRRQNHLPATPRQLPYPTRPRLQTPHQSRRLPHRRKSPRHQSPLQEAPPMSRS